MLEHSKASWNGYGGSRGGAKSGGLRRSMVRRRLAYPGTRGEIIRRVWKDVKLNHVDPFFSEFPELREFYKEQDHEVTLPNGSKINFNAYETRGDVERASRGPEYFDKFIDQAEQFTEAELMDFKKTCRWPDTPDFRCKMGLFFNPGGPGAAFLRRIFHTHEYHENERAEDYAFLQAYVWDNVEWSRQALKSDGIDQFIGTGDPRDFYQWDGKKRFEYTINRTQYGRVLNELPEAMRMGELLGEFTKFAGQYFSNFDVAKHVKTQPMRQWMRRWISIDWGFSPHPSAVYWHCALDDDHVHTYREMVERELTPEKLCNRIRTLTPTTEQISAIVIDPSVAAKRDSPESILLQMNTHLRRNNLPVCIDADNDRKSGWMLMYAMLDTVCWTIDPACTKLTDCLPMLIRDQDKPEDALKVEGDDPADSVRYGLKWHLSAASKPQAVIDQEQASKIDDPYARHFFLVKRQQQRDTSAIFVPQDVEIWRRQ